MNKNNGNIHSPIIWLLMAVHVAVAAGSFWYFREDSLLLQMGKSYLIVCGSSLLSGVLFKKELQEHQEKMFDHKADSIKPSRKRK